MGEEYCSSLHELFCLLNFLFTYSLYRSNTKSRLYFISYFLGREGMANLEGSLPLRCEGGFSPAAWPLAGGKAVGGCVQAAVDREEEG